MTIVAIIGVMAFYAILMGFIAAMTFQALGNRHAKVVLISLISTVIVTGAYGLIMQAIGDAS